MIDKSTTISITNMSFIVSTISEAVIRVCRLDPIYTIDLTNKQHTDDELLELIDCLLAHPNAVRLLWLGSNQLTDKTGVKLARFLGSSTAIESIGLDNNQFGEVTYLAVAAALRINTSLRGLHLHRNLTVEKRRIDTAFIDALILNPNRPTNSWWHFYSMYDEFDRLKKEAEQQGHPSMQAMLSTQLIKVF